MESLVKRQEDRHGPLEYASEIDPSGERRLPPADVKKGRNCRVISPGRTPKKVGDHGKNGTLDAITLAGLLVN
jgi:hypothetical protein